jgi:hypothetical protein
MNVKIQEDSRTLREFYPDPEARYQIHYEFAHRFLHRYVHLNPYAFFSYLYRSDITGETLEPPRFIQSRWDQFEKMLGLVERAADPMRDGIVFRRVTDLTMSTLEVAGRPVALVQMPSPEGPVNAFFVAAALLASPAHPEGWPCDVQARVLTLEALCWDHPDAGKAGLFCEWTREGEHRNFGVLVPAERDMFLRAVAAALKNPDLPAIASHTPPKEGT